MSRSGQQCARCYSKPFNQVRPGQLRRLFIEPNQLLALSLLLLVLQVADCCCSPGAAQNPDAGPGQPEGKRCWHLVNTFSCILLMTWQRACQASCMMLSPCNLCSGLCCGGCESAAAHPPPSAAVQVYSGVWQGLKHMAQTEGVAGMMRGNLTNCIRIVPNQAVSRARALAGLTLPHVHERHCCSIWTFMTHVWSHGLPVPGRSSSSPTSSSAGWCRTRCLRWVCDLLNRLLCCTDCWGGAVARLQMRWHTGLNTAPPQHERASPCGCVQRGGDGQMTPLLRLSVGACAGIVGMSATCAPLLPPPAAKRHAATPPVGALSCHAQPLAPSLLATTEVAVLL